MTSLQLYPAYLIGLILESWIIGLYALVFGTSLYVLAVKKSVGVGTENGRANISLIAISTLLFILALIHWALGIALVWVALVVDQDVSGGPTTPHGALDCLLSARSVLFLCEVGVADLVFLYRLWVVCDRNKVLCVFPALATGACIANGFVAASKLAQVQYQQDVFLPSFEYIVVGYTTTLSTNIYCSVLIAYRIWSTTRHLRSPKLLGVLRIIVESALLYTVITFLVLVMYIVRSNTYFIFLSMASPVVGLAVSLITVRVGLGIGEQHVPLPVLGGLSQAPFPGGAQA